MLMSKQAMNPDSLSLLLICSQLGLADESIKPLTLREWNPLMGRMQSVSLRPSDLITLSEPDFHLKLDIDAGLASRILQLLSRDIKPELNHLASIGIQLLTRADPDYPEKYRQHLKDSAPLVLFYAGEKALLGQPGIAVVGSRHLDEAGQECGKFVGNACGMSGRKVRGSGTGNPGRFPCSHGGGP